MMLPSGNDAAYCLAKSINNSVKNFCKLMNKKAKTLGMYNTVFENPHGNGGKNLSTAN